MLDVVVPDQTLDQVILPLSVLSQRTQSQHAITHVIRVVIPVFNFVDRLERCFECFGQVVPERKSEVVFDVVSQYLEGVQLLVL